MSNDIQEAENIMAEYKALQDAIVRFSKKRHKAKIKVVLSSITSVACSGGAVWAGLPLDVFWGGFLACCSGAAAVYTGLSAMQVKDSVDSLVICTRRIRDLNGQLFSPAGKCAESLARPGM